MKTTKIIITLCLLALAYSFFSCSDSSDDPDIPNPPIVNEKKEEIYTFKENAYAIKDQTLYAGIHDGTQYNLTQDHIKRYWGSFEEPEYYTMIVSSNKDSVILENRRGSLIVDYEAKIVNDSMYLKQNNGEYILFGEYSTTNTFIHSAGFYWLTHKGDSESPSYFGRGRTSKLQDVQTIFYKGAVFESLESMTQPTDTVAWCNIFYTFEKAN